MSCYVCGRPATQRVVAEDLLGKPVVTYLACDDHIPTHIPGGNVAVIKTTAIGGR